MIAGKVMHGHIVADVDLPDGSNVTILVDDAPVTLTAEEEQELAESIADIENGNVVEYRSLDEMLTDLCP